VTSTSFQSVATQVFPPPTCRSPIDLYTALASTLPITLIKLGALVGAPGRFTLLGLVSSTHTLPAAAYAEPGSLRPPTLPYSALGSLQPPTSSSALSSQHSALPHGPGWFLALPYELGHTLEPASSPHSVTSGSPPHSVTSSSDPSAKCLVPSALPLLWHRIDTALIHDSLTDTWSGFGHWESLLTLANANAPATSPFSLAPIDTTANRERFLASVRATLNYIRAGDIYQANITHTLRSTFSGSPLSLAAHLFTLANPAHGCITSFTHDNTHHTLISCSPELFLAGNLHARTIITRPMKGTRPAHTDPSELDHSIKDQAELAMIIDLMRNDLGRVCDIGSIHVDSPRNIENHGILQATGTIRGTLREGTTLDALLRATFPGGSITGAPKIRAQQIIAQLESAPRGYYCGATGYLADNGTLELNIAIRTAHLTTASSPHSATLPLCHSATSGSSPHSATPSLRHSVTSGSSPHSATSSSPPQHSALSTQHFAFSIGSGIVADSDPEAEWRETLDKAWLLRHLADLK
jgi:anthranilate/para-aminobenzoate synthase component I